MRQLISYIAPAAPATRRYATGNEPFLRPEFGFTPKWFYENFGITFGRDWHTNPRIRRESILKMRQELQRRFPGTNIGHPHLPVDMLTGTFGACTIGAIYGLPILYSKDGWPICAQDYLSDDQAASLTPPDLNSNRFFQDLLNQMTEIENLEGRIEGFINWQGVLNNAHRLRGEALFYDLMDEPDRARRVFECVAQTMIQAITTVYERQRQSAVERKFVTVSNCLVNMVSPRQYQQFLLPWDIAIAQKFACIGIHNCAWTADPYLDLYAQVPQVAYIDMGIQSDLPKAKMLFPTARRAIMYTPMDLSHKSLAQIKADLEKIATEYGPCDIVAADIEAGTPDAKIMEFANLCRVISEKMESPV